MKKLLATVLALAMVLSLIPATALAAEITTDFAANVNVNKDGKTFGGRDTLLVEFQVKTLNGKTIQDTQAVALYYDASLFELVDYPDDPEDFESYDPYLTSELDPMETPIGLAKNWKIGTTSGKQGYILLQPSLTVGGKVTALDTEGAFYPLAWFRLAIKDGKTIDDVTSQSIRLITLEEANVLNQSSLCIVNDGTIGYLYGEIGGDNTFTGNDTLAKPTFTYTGFTPAKAVPVCSAPTGITAIYGDMLSTVTLTNPAGNTPGTWTWENGTQAVGNVGNKNFTATFTPADTETYRTVTGIQVPVEVKAKTLSDVAIDDIPAQPYTGSAIEPGITVTGDGITLTKDIDYTVKYDNNTDVGTATVTVKATAGGNYTFADVTKDFVISKAASAISISGDLNVTYGTSVPVPTVSKTDSTGAVTFKYFTNEACTEGESATAPTNAGSYWVKAYLAADTNYDAAESAPLAFTISPKAITAGDFTVNTQAKTYTGSVIQPTVTSSLVKGTDYTVAYGDNTNAGTNAGTITITGIGNYTGSVEKTFTINPKAIAESDFTIDTAAKDYTGTQITPDVSSVVIPTTGYTVTYGENINAGTNAGTITITGQGNYTGTINQKFTINKIAYSGAKTQAITVLSSTYDDNTSSSYTADLSALIAPGGSLGTPVKGEGTMVTGATVTGTSLNITVKPAAAGTVQTITVPVTGCTNHSDYAITVTVTSADKQSATVTITGDTVTYDGQPHELDVQWPDNKGTQTVTYTKDGETSETAPEAAGTYTVTATYENDTHYGTATATLTIEPLEAALTWSGTENLVYDGTAKNVTASVSNLVSGDSCAVTVTGGTEKDAGTHTATATSLDNSNYKLPATATKSYTISPKVITFAVTVTPASADYNGAAQTVTVTVKDGDAVLASSSDYSVTLPTDMTNAGQKTITVTGAGNYAGSTGSGVFTIEKISQDALTISSVGDKTYGDAPFTVTVSGGTGSGAVTMVSSDPNVLSVEKSDSQFTAAIVGTGTVTLTATKAGDTNHRDTTATLTLQVNPKDISGATVTLPENFQPSYTGSAIMPDVTVTLDGKILVKDKDYNVKYDNNVNAGTATVAVTGIGNYTGTAPSQTFTISKADISAMKPTVTGTAQVGNTLSASLTGVDAGAITWQWYRGETAIEGATASTYVLVTADSNKEILVKATAEENSNYTGTASSDPVQVAKQVITGSVTITASTEEVKTGTVLTAANENIQPEAARTGGTWQWYRDGSAIEGADAAAYTVTDDDAGTTLKAVFTPNENFAGTAAASMEVGKIALGGTLTITGDPAVGSVLTAEAAGAPAAENYTIQWLRNGAVIPGAEDMTYTVTKADQGKTISAKLVAAADGKYTGEVAADGIAIPATAPDAPVVTATAASQKVTLVWTVPADNGAAITGYIVQQGDQEAVAVDASITSYVFGNLENGKEYTFTVKAVNSVGSSEAASVTASPKADSNSSGGAGGVVTYTLTFESNGGTAVKAVTKAVGSVVDLGAYTPTRDGYTFAGWYSEASLTNRVTSVKLDQNRTVYAKWTENTPVSGLPFTDVAGNDWFLEAVTYVYEAGIMKGVTDTTFAPKSFTTRGQIVTMLYRQEGSPAVSGAASFADVSADAYYAAPVAWAAANGIVNGYDAATFGPDGNVTREQLAAILYRYAQYKHADVSASADLSGFADAGSVSSYAVSAMQWAVGAGIINGRGENQLAPSGTATRAEVATMIMRFVENIL